MNRSNEQCLQQQTSNNVSDICTSSVWLKEWITYLYPIMQLEQLWPMHYTTDYEPEWGFHARSDRSSNAALTKGLNDVYCNSTRMQWFDICWSQRLQLFMQYNVFLKVNNIKSSWDHAWLIPYFSLLSYDYSWMCSLSYFKSKSSFFGVTVSNCKLYFLASCLLFACVRC